MTIDFNEYFTEKDFMDSNDRYHKIFNLTNEGQNKSKSKIHYEKNMSNHLICYHFKHPDSKQLKHKQGNIYLFWLYHQNDQTSISFCSLFFTSNVNYPNHLYDNHLYLFSNNIVSKY